MRRSDTVVLRPSRILSGFNFCSDKPIAQSTDTDWRRRPYDCGAGTVVIQKCKCPVTSCHPFAYRIRHFWRNHLDTSYHDRSLTALCIRQQYGVDTIQSLSSAFHRHGRHFWVIIDELGLTGNPHLMGIASGLAQACILRSAASPIYEPQLYRLPQMICVTKSVLLPQISEAGDARNETASRRAETRLWRARGPSNLFEPVSVRGWRCLCCREHRGRIKLVSKSVCFPR
jgi:hypothetical protein